MNKDVRRNRYLFYSIWTIAALFTSTSLYLKTLQSGGSEPWLKLFIIQLIVWNIWGSLSPVIFWLGKKYRIDRQSFVKGIVIHSIIAAAMVLIYLALYSALWNIVSFGKISSEGFLGFYQVFFLNLFHWYFFIYMAIIGYGHATQYHQELKNKELESVELERELAISELKMLKAQLEPHFLFNAINNVVSSIEQGKSKVATGMLLKLSEFFRMTLAESRNTMVPLNKELDYIGKYLEIEKFRNKSLEVVIDVPDEMKKTKVPAFILQPLVENAIKHGISKQQSANRIEIGANQSDSQLKLWVYNEGPALNVVHENGIGIRNTRSRLKKLFHHESDISLITINDGVMAEIDFPMVS